MQPVYIVGAARSVLGRRGKGLSTVHPADLLGDWRMEIGDSVAYWMAWKMGGAWSIPPTPVSLSGAINGALIWKLGEYYDNEAGIAPAWWVVVDPDTGSVGN